MTTTLISNIGEFFTGDLNAPRGDVGSLLIEDKFIKTLNPTVDENYDKVIDAEGCAVLPGLVDGHIHPVFGEWTPTQDTMGWIGNYMHGGSTSMISAGELHTPGLDYNNLSADLVTSLAEVTCATTNRVRWSNVKVHAGTALLVPGMTEKHFDRLAEAGSILVKFIFFPLEENRREAIRYTDMARERGIRTKVHTGGVSRSGSSQICGFDTLSWLSNSLNAQNWQYFVSDSSVDTIINCYMGDLNNDELLSILDILILLDIILGNIEYYNENADMNYDQILNIQDILILIQEILNN